MLRKCIAVLWVCVLAAGISHAQPPDRGESLSGTVIQSEGGQPIGGAEVSVFNGQELLQKTRTGPDGAFIAGPLLMAATRTEKTTYGVVTQATGYAPAVQTVFPGAFLPRVEIKMSPEISRLVRVVGVDGTKLEGAEIKVLGFDPRPLAVRGPREGISAAVFEIDTPIVTTAADGVARIKGLPAVGTVSLEITCPGYATTIRHIDAKSGRPAVFTLSRETIVAGRVLFTDTREPFIFTGVTAKAQMIRRYTMYRLGKISPDGSFEIRNVPSLEMTGEPFLSLVLDLGDAKAEPLTADGQSIRYARYGLNWDVAVSRVVKGETRWYLGLFDLPSAGAVYREGETVQHDILLQPAARITGRVLPVPATTVDVTPEPAPDEAAPAPAAAPPVPKPVRIFYRDPRTGNPDWSVKADEDGRFEIFALPGDLMLLVLIDGQLKQVAVRGLKPYETRNIQIARQ